MCLLVDFIDPRLVDKLKNPRTALLPEADWPAATPVSRVHAVMSQWYKLVKAGCGRNMFVEVAESEIFRNQHGDLVLNGAMGVNKIKVVDGVEVRQLRFICILTCLNQYMRKFKGDSSLLPQASMVAHMFLEEDELVWTDGEDLQSCFNLFYLPDAWRGFFVFSQKVSRGAFGGNPAEETYVAVRMVPMGWLNSVDIIQNFIRRFVFAACKFSPGMEVRKDKPFPPGDVAVVCMDGVDVVSKIIAEGKTFRGLYSDLSKEGSQKSRLMRKFVKECHKRGLPLNAGKSICKSFCATILGGELDGISGCLMHDRAKGHRFICRSLAILSLPKVSQAAIQHWSGLFCFWPVFAGRCFLLCKMVGFHLLH